MSVVVDISLMVKAAVTRTTKSLYEILRAFASFHCVFSNSVRIERCFAHTIQVRKSLCKVALIRLRLSCSVASSGFGARGTQKLLGVYVR